MDKKKQPPIIEQYDPVIYPLKLWVAIADDYKDVAKMFISARDKQPLDLTDDGLMEASTEYVIKDEGERYYGVLIVFLNIEDMTMRTIAHEASHAADIFWHHMRETHVCGEANAYLTGWIAKCMGSTYHDNKKHGKRNKIH